MRLTAAFFANHAEVVDDMLNVQGAFWRTTTVPAGSVGFRSCAVVLCDMDELDVGKNYSLQIDAQGPLGHELTPAFATDFTIESPSMFFCFTEMVLPIDPGGGRHVYTFRLDGQHDRIAVPLAVRIKRS